MRTPVLLCLCALPVYGAFGQTADDSLTFEVALVKLHAPTAEGPSGPSVIGGPGTDDPGRITITNRTLRSLIIESYGINGFQIEHPAWVGENRYDIVAKVPSGASKQQTAAMMRNLLVERFQLRIRRDTRNMSVYALVAADGGPKLRPSAKLETSSGAPAAVAGGIYTLVDGGKTSAAKGFSLSLSKIASWLSGVVGQPVVDRTDLAGEYDFDLVWAPNSDPDADVSLDLFAAIRRQLGLSLERRRMPVEILIIDSALKVPTEN